MASHAGGSVQSGFMTFWRNIRLQPNLLRYMLVGVRFRCRTHFREFLRRHDQQKLVSRLRQKNEILRTIASPARWDRNPILLVNGMPELAGIEAFGLGIGVHLSRGAIAHFTPLDPTI